MAMKRELEVDRSRASGGTTQCACGRYAGASFQLPRARRVAAAFFADLDLSAYGRIAEARPPRRPPLCDEEVSFARPTPDPLFLPPWSCLFTVAQARRSASLSGTPRFS